jgi:hypothetical protein
MRGGIATANPLSYAIDAIDALRGWALVGPQLGSMMGVCRHHIPLSA